MKYPYEIIKKDGSLVFEFEKEYEVLTDFLITDIAHISGGNRYLKAVSEVVKTNSAKEMTGNTTTVSMTKDKTKIKNNYYELSCEIETAEFKKIIEEYIQELKNKEEK